MTSARIALGLLCAVLCSAADNRPALQLETGSLYAVGAVNHAARMSETEDARWRRDRLLWRASALTYVAANALDYASSVALRGAPGVYESNPLQTGGNGQFAPGRGAAIKVGLTLGLLVPEYFLLRSHPKMARAFTVINFGASSVPVWAGAHNLSLMRY